MWIQIANPLAATNGKCECAKLITSCIFSWSRFCADVQRLIYAFEISTTPIGGKAKNHKAGRYTDRLVNILICTIYCPYCHFQTFLEENTILSYPLKRLVKCLVCVVW